MAVSEFVGAPEVIAHDPGIAGPGDDLDDLTARQLDKVLLRAAGPRHHPRRRPRPTEAEAAQSAVQDGFVYQLDDPQRPEEQITANAIDRLLVESRDLAERRIIWEASKTIGIPLRDGLLRLRDLRNKVARELGFDDFFALQVADYGMTVDQMLALSDGFLADVKPLYEQLHTWAKHALAARYGAERARGARSPPTGCRTAGARTGRGWSRASTWTPRSRGSRRSSSPSRPSGSTSRSASPSCRESFYEKSDLYPADPGSGRKKNCTPAPGTSTCARTSAA